MSPARIRPVGPRDAGALNAALARLSGDLGDRHLAGDADLRAALERPLPPFRALLADDGAAGVALYSPWFSTVRGAAGIYVSDLWVAPDRRGQGMGRRLLVAALEDGAAQWGAGFLRLSVYHVSAEARRFYVRLGFRPYADQDEMVLDAAGCAALKGLE